MNYQIKSLIAAIVLASLCQGCVHGGRHMVDCQHCGAKVCSVESSVGKEEQLAFEVKPKDICVPPIMLPWEKCISNRCGKVREICVLEETKTEKDVCEYEWSVKTVCPKCKQHCK